MTLLRKSILTGVLALIAIIAGFVFLLKGCLAKYDERFVKLPALVVEQSGKTVIFSIVEFQKTTSYSQKGNFIRKSVNTSYYIQTNDGATAALIASKKIKTHRQIKNHPVEMLGASGSTAWVFMSEPMAFDAFTLEKKADIPILEEKNPAMKGKFPGERQFYSFNSAEKMIYITATDGTRWQLNTTTLIASPSTYDGSISPMQNKLTALEKELKKNRDEQDTLYQRNNYGASRQYAEKKITYAQYQQLTTQYYKERERLSNQRDSLEKIRSQWQRNKQQTEDTKRIIENLQRTSMGYSSCYTNQDTSAATWYGMYSDEELDKLYDRVSDQRAYDETIRRKLFTSRYTYSRNDDALIDKDAAKNITDAGFLAGGFLMNKQTARPIRLPGSQSFLVVHKDQVGRDGNILVSGVTTDGKTTWTCNTHLTQWGDWYNTSQYLYVFGTDNKNLSSNECNVLLCIQLSTGAVSKFDYFTNKKKE